VTAPAVSVVMPVHNAAPFLPASVESILGQTLEDLEVVVLENGSTDGSGAILRRYAEADPRIHLFEEPRALGLVESSNRVVSHARAPLVARMDADDVSHPDRLRRELEVMHDEPDAVAVGTLADGIDSTGAPVRPRDRWRLVRCAEAPFAHGSAMIRRQAFEAVGGYREGAIARDVELFLRLADHGRILVLPDALYRVRFHPGSTSVSITLEQMASSKDMLHRALRRQRAGLDHGDVTEREPAELDPDAVPLALYNQGAMRIWAGVRPGILPEVRRRLRAGEVRTTRAWSRTLVLAVWGELSPRTLRACLRLLVRVRDRLASTRLEKRRSYEWRLG